MLNRKKKNSQKNKKSSCKGDLVKKACFLMI